MTTHKTRFANLSKIIDLLREYPSITVNQLSALTNLSRVTVTKILTTLSDDGVVTRIASNSSTIKGGKPPRLYSLATEGFTIIGIHFSGNHFHGSLVDLHLKVLSTASKLVPKEINADELLDLLESMIKELIESAEHNGVHCLGIGIGTPGITDLGLGEVVFSPHHPGIGEHFALRDLLQKRVNNIAPVYVDNSIRFKTIAEYTMGHLRGVLDGTVIYCDDGLISGLILDGQIRRGFNNFAGSIGHMTLNTHDTIQCACGGVGCWESLVSPKRLIDEMRTRLLQNHQDVNSHENVNDVNSIMRMAEEGNPDAIELVDKVAKWFAIGIHNIILSYDPEVIVIQGVYANSESRLFRSLYDNVKNISLSRAPLKTKILCSDLGNNATNLGAASFSLSMTLARLKDSLKTQGMKDYHKSTV